jgi:uncharacterized protein YdaU (DUF1376 family)
MTAEQRGWYIQLLCHAWNAEPCGTLPDDVRKLKALAGAGDNWDTDKDAVLDCFETISVEDGGPAGIRLVNRRLEEQFNERVAFCERQAVNGTKGGRPRKNPDQTQNNPGLSSSFNLAEPKPNPEKGLQSSDCSLQFSAQFSSAEEAASERQETDRSKSLDRDLVLFWAENVSDFWPGKTITDKVYPKVAVQCDKYLAALSPEKRKALLTSVYQKTTPIPPPPPKEQDEREGDYDCACADPKPDTNGDSLEMYGASCTRCGGFVVRPRVFQIEEVELPKNKAFDIED